MALGNAAMDFTITATFPEGALTQSDVRSTFRDVVGHRLRRAMEKISAHAAADYAGYPNISGGFRVEQLSGGSDLELGIRNDIPYFPFVENDTVPHFPPWGPGSPLAAWSEAHGIPAFLVARGISEHGTKGHYRLQAAWSDGQSDLEDSVREGLIAWLESWGASSGA